MNANASNASDAPVDANVESRGREGPRGIDAVLSPRSVAVVGVSLSVDSIGHRIVENLLEGGFVGPIFPVGRHGEFAAGIPVVRDISDIAGRVDLAVIAVEAPAVLEAARACVRAGVRGLVVVSAGFSEIGPEGQARQRELRDITRAAGIRLIGPNCLGVINPAPGVSMRAVFARIPVADGPMALMTQSGAVGMTLAASAHRRGLGLSSFVSVGNKADVSGNDLLEHWERDERTSVIALYLESFGNPRRFATVARAVSMSKPIVALKAGRSPAGSRAAGSHTAALALPDATVDALFAQTGVIRVDDLRSMLDVCDAFAHLPLPRGRRVAVVGNAGGLGILAADALAANGCSLAALGPTTLAAVRAVAPANASVADPVDLTAAVGADAFAECVRAVLADDAVDGVITVHAVVDPASQAVLGELLGAAARAARKPLLRVLEDPSPCIAVDGTTVVELPEQAALVLSKLADRREWLTASSAAMCRPIDAAAIVRVRMMLERARERAVDGWVDTCTAFAVAATCGVRVASPVLVTSEDQAAAAAAAIGFPVSVKAANAALVHRSDRHAIRLDLRDEFSVASAFDAIRNQLGDEMGGAIVQPMAAKGVEMIVGITNDPRFGPLVLVGAGGREAELWKDTSLQLAPLATGEAAHMVAGLRSAPLLRGFRGAPACDVDALVDALERLGQLAVDVPEIAEMDVNPLIVLPDGAIGVDVKLRLQTTSPTKEERP